MENNIEDMRLFPYFPQMIEHYDNLTKIKINKAILKDKFPKELAGLNFKDFKLEYADVFQDPKELKELDAIIDYSLRELGRVIMLSKDKIDEVTKCIDVYEIGAITSFNFNEGYIIVNNEDEHHVFKYVFGLLDEKGNKTLKTKPYRVYPRNMGMTYESIKLDLISSGDIKHPSVFLVDCPFNYSIKETLLPITKRILIKKLLALQTIL